MSDDRFLALMEPTTIEALQDLPRDEWRLDRPVITNDTIRLRLVKRIREDIHEVMVRRAAGLKEQLGSLSWADRWFLRARYAGIRSRLIDAEAEATRFEPGVDDERSPRSVMREWRYASSDFDSDHPFALQAAIAYELTGRALDMAGNAMEVVVNVYVSEIDPATGHTLSLCVLAVRFDRPPFEAQVHSRVDPAAAVRRVFDHRTATQLRLPDPVTTIRPFKFEHLELEADDAPLPLQIEALPDE